MSGNIEMLTICGTRSNGFWSAFAKNELLNNHFLQFHVNNQLFFNML